MGEDFKGFYLAPNGRFFEVWNDGIDDRVNINDFFFMCKEWSLEQGHRLLSGVMSDLMLCEERYHCDVHKLSVMYDDKYESFGGKSEQQAVFDACQWILEKGNK